MSTFSSLFAGTCGETVELVPDVDDWCRLSVPSLQGHVVKQLADVPCRLGLRPVWGGVFSKSLQWPLPPRCFAKFPFHLPLGPTTPECQALAPTRFDPRHSLRCSPTPLDFGTSPLNLPPPPMPSSKQDQVRGPWHHVFEYGPISPKATHPQTSSHREWWGSAGTPPFAPCLPC